MKRIIFLISFIFIPSIQLFAHSQLQNVEYNNPCVCPLSIDTAEKEKKATTVNQNIQNDDNDTKRILSTFFDMLGDFVNILKDPNDPYHVAAQIAQIVKTLVCLGVEEFNKGISVTDDAEELKELLSDYQLDQEYILALKNRFIAYAEQIKQIDMMKVK